MQSREKALEPLYRGPLSPVGTSKKFGGWRPSGRQHLLLCTLVLLVLSFVVMGFESAAQVEVNAALRAGYLAKGGDHPSDLSGLGKAVVTASSVTASSPSSYSTTVTHSLSLGITTGSGSGNVKTGKLPTPTKSAVLDSDLAAAQAAQELAPPKDKAPEMHWVEFESKLKEPSAEDEMEFVPMPDITLDMVFDDVGENVEPEAIDDIDGPAPPVYHVKESLPLTFQQKLVLRKVEKDEIKLLDWLNGELVAENKSNLFGGSLLHDPGFDALPPYERVVKYAESVNEGYNRLDFDEMARRARALHILLRVAMREVSPAVLAHKESRKALSAMQAFAHVEETVAKLTRSLYPWLYPTYKSIQEMYINTLKGSDEWGIVTTGGGKHFYMMQHLIVSLREMFQIDAPIQIFYGGAKDLDPAQVRVLESYEGVTTHNALNYFPHETRQWGQWSLKPFSMLASSFRRVLFIDADVLFFQDPIRAVLRHPAFKETRQMFFRDRKIYDERFIGGSELFRDMNKYKSQYAKTLGYARAYEDMTGETHQMESGVIAMDKGDFGVLMGLLLAAKMNSKDERDDMLYALTWGDKEAFWFATEALRIPYRFNEAYGGCLGESGKLKDPALDRNTTCGPGLLQVDHKLQPLFFNGGFLRDRYAEPEKAEFIPYDRIGTDVRGDVRWVGGGCLHGKEDNVRPTNEKEKRIFKDLERLFKNLTVV